MATSDAPLLVLNCGNTRVSAAVFLSDGRATPLGVCGLRELDYDYNQEEGWLDALADAVKSMKRRGSCPQGEITSSRARFLTKKGKVQDVEPAKQRQITVSSPAIHPPSLAKWSGTAKSCMTTGSRRMSFSWPPSGRIYKNFMTLTKEWRRPTSIAASPVLDYNVFSIPTKTLVRIACY